MDTATVQAMGRELATRRVEQGLTHDALARAVGSRAVVVARWERGEAIPNEEEARALVSVLGLPAGTAAVWAAARTDLLTAGSPPRQEGPSALRRREEYASYLDDPRERRHYAIRWTLTVVILGALAILLLWAMDELAAAWRSMLDLLRGGEPSPAAAWLPFLGV